MVIAAARAMHVESNNGFTVQLLYVERLAPKVAGPALLCAAEISSHRLLGQSHVEQKLDAFGQLGWPPFKRDPIN